MPRIDQPRGQLLAGARPHVRRSRVLDEQLRVVEPDRLHVAGGTHGSRQAGLDHRVRGPTPEDLLTERDGAPHRFPLGQDLLRRPGHSDERHQRRDIAQRDLAPLAVLVTVQIVVLLYGLHAEVEVQGVAGEVPDARRDPLPLEGSYDQVAGHALHLAHVVGVAGLAEGGVVGRLPGAEVGAAEHHRRLAGIGRPEPSEAHPLAG